MILQIKSIHDQYPEKGLKQICKDLQEKEPRFFRSFLNCNRRNRILSNTEDWVIFSQQTQPFMEDFDRAGFSRIHEHYFMGWASDAISQDDFDELRLDADHFSTIKIGIDNDYNLCMYFPEKNYDELPYTEDHKIAYIGASYAEIQSVCQNLRNMGVELSHTPTLSADYADEIRRVIHSL